MILLLANSMGWNGSCVTEGRIRYNQLLWFDLHDVATKNENNKVKTHTRTQELVSKTRIPKSHPSTHAFVSCHQPKLIPLPSLTPSPLLPWPPLAALSRAVAGEAVE